MAPTHLGLEGIRYANQMSFAVSRISAGSEVGGKREYEIMRNMHSKAFWCILLQVSHISEGGRREEGGSKLAAYKEEEAEEVEKPTFGRKGAKGEEAVKDARGDNIHALLTKPDREQIQMLGLTEAFCKSCRDGNCRTLK